MKQESACKNNNNLKIMIKETEWIWNLIRDETRQYITKMKTETYQDKYKREQLLAFFLRSFLNVSNNK